MKEEEGRRKMFNPDDFDLQCIVGEAARHQYIEHGPDNWVSVGKAVLFALDMHLRRNAQNELKEEEIVPVYAGCGRWR